MSVTVKDCLKLPSLRKAEVVSGHNGLSKIVNSVSVLEFVENNILSNSRIFNANEILISAFASIRDDVKAQCKTIELLFNTGDVAIILFYVGYILPEIDQKVLDKSDELGLPLIVMPKNEINLGYNEVLFDITEVIFNDKYHQIHFTNNLLERISQLHEKQRTLPNIMQMLSNHLKCSLLLCDHYGKGICFIKRPLSNWLSESLILDLFKNKIPSGEIDFSEILSDSDSEAIVYRVSMTKKPHNHLSLILVDENNELEKEDILSAIELLEVSSSIWKYRIDSLDLNSLIPAILTDNINRMRQIADIFSIHLASINAMLIIRLKNDRDGFHEKYSKNEKIDAIVRKKLKSAERPPLSTIYGELIIVALKYDDCNEQFMDKQFLDELKSSITAMEKNVTFTFFQNMAATDEMRQNYVDYCAQIEYAQTIFPFKTDFSKVELDFALDCAKSMNAIDSHLNIFDLLYNQNDAEDLLETLQIFLLDANSDTKKTGELMFLHRNTILYRLNKIKAQIKCDLDKMPAAYILYKASALKRLKDANLDIDPHRLQIDMKLRMPM